MATKKARFEVVIFEPKDLASSAWHDAFCGRSVIHPSNGKLFWWGRCLWRWRAWSFELGFGYDEDPDEVIMVGIDNGHDDDGMG